MAQKRKPIRLSLPQLPKNFRLNRRTAFIVAAVLCLLAGIGIGLAAYSNRYNSLIYPRTYIGGVNYGGLSQGEAAEKFNETLRQLPSDFNVHIDDAEKKTISTKDIALSFDSAATVKKLYAQGRTGSLRIRTVSFFRSLFGRNTVDALFTYDHDKTENILEKVAKENGSLAEDAKLVLRDEANVEIDSAKSGQGVTIDELESSLVSNLKQLRFRIDGATHSITPAITEEQLADAQAQAQRIIDRAPLTIKADTITSTFDKEEVFSWIITKEQEKTLIPTASPAPLSYLVDTVVAKITSDQIITATLDAAKVKKTIEPIASSIDREAANAELKAENGKITVAKTEVKGRKLAIDQSVTDIITYLTQSEAPVSDALTLNVSVVEPTVRSDNIEALGIKELIGRAETSFKGSPANRVHNITTGARYLNGILIAPNEEFSTVKNLGAVDDSTGYLPELVIKENRTIPEFGGGLCQVSTTLFRSTLNASLKITERQNHSYRVSYYEPPLGLDATIYLPRPDFKFFNDTPGYILVQNKVEGTKITFELYGTKDGRSSTISDTTITNITEPAEAIYIDTDTLPKGETKQIEKAHQGATTSVTYTVTRDGKEINKQIFKSRYKAWQAQYLVGTRE